jgi:hypothetical protein
MDAPTLQIKILCPWWPFLVVSEVYKNSPWKIQTTVVRVILNPILSPQIHCFVGRGKQIRPRPHPCKCKQVQALPTFYNFSTTRIKGTNGGRFQWAIKMEQGQPIKNGGSHITKSRRSFNYSSIGRKKFDNKLKFKDITSSKKNLWLGIET